MYLSFSPNHEKEEHSARLTSFVQWAPYSKNTNYILGDLEMAPFSVISMWFSNGRLYVHADEYAQC